MPRRIRLEAPKQGDTERTDKTGQVQRPPGLKPGNRRNTRIEQCEIGKQHQIIAAAVGHQNRCGHPADDRGLSHYLGILPHRHHGHRRHQYHHRSKHCGRGQQGVQLQSRQRGQVHHRHAETLQNQAVFAPPALQLPARNHSGQTAARHRQITQSDWDMDAFGSITQQKGQAEEQHHDACFQQQIAARQTGKQRAAPVGCRLFFRRPRSIIGRPVGRLPLFGFNKGGCLKTICRIAFRRPVFYCRCLFGLQMHLLQTADAGCLRLCGFVCRVCRGNGRCHFQCRFGRRRHRHGIGYG